MINSSVPVTRGGGGRGAGERQGARDGPFSRSWPRPEGGRERRMLPAVHCPAEGRGGLRTGPGRGSGQVPGGEQLGAVGSWGGSAARSGLWSALSWTREHPQLHGSCSPSWFLAASGSPGAWAVEQGSRAAGTEGPAGQHKHPGIRVAVITVAGLSSFAQMSPKPLLNLGENDCSGTHQLLEPGFSMQHITGVHVSLPWCAEAAAPAPFPLLRRREPVSSHTTCKTSGMLDFEILHRRGKRPQ